MSYDAATMREKILNNEGVEDELVLNEDEDSETKMYDTPPTTLELLGVISLKQNRVWGKLFKEYGRFTWDVFNLATLEKIFLVSPLSKRRLLRRIMIKILEARMTCSNNDCPPEDEDEFEDQNLNKNIPIFHWTTIGDSSAAGHGNTYSQSYTAILEKTVTDAFATAGVRFVATNHAGDVWSGMELAFCLESIVGKDVDILSWDFSLSDPEDFSNPFSPGQGIDPAFLGERAGRVMNSMPFLLFLRILSDIGSLERIRKLESRGVGTGTLDEDALRKLILTFPNQNLQWVPKSPPSIDKFNCGGIIEGKTRCDDPTMLYWCDAEKGEACVKARYDAGKSCNNDQYQTSWNDGRKMHLLKGSLLGYFLVEMLRLAIVELDSLEQTGVFHRNDPVEAVRILKAEEEVEEFLFYKTQPSKGDETKRIQTGSFDWLKMKSSICVTSMSISHGRKAFGGLEYFPGEEFLCKGFLPFQNAFLKIDDSGNFARVDPWNFADILGKQKSIVRSEGEQKGVVLAICLTKCYGNQCGPHDPSVTGLQISWNKVEIHVDGILVRDLKPLGGCYFLKDQNGLIWDDKVVGKSSSGVQIRVHQGGESMFLTSSFVLY